MDKGKVSVIFKAYRQLFEPNLDWLATRGLLKPQARITKLKPKPKIICLCGSTRFTNEMLIKQWELTKQGIIVLSWCALPDWYSSSEDKNHVGDQEGVTSIVDEVHKRKIDLADEVIIIRAGEATKGLTHIGESTYSELSYAYAMKKPVDFSPPDEALKFNWNHQHWEITILEAQDAKTTSILDTECQARVQKIFKEIEDEFPFALPKKYKSLKDVPWWQAVKKKEGK